MSTREGPSVKVDRSCFGCRYEASSRYACQGDSGHDVSCTHPSIGARAVGDSTWKTPDWCPFLAVPSSGGAAVVPSDPDTLRLVENQIRVARRVLRGANSQLDSVALKDVEQILTGGIERLAELRRLNPAPSTASASESEEK